MLFNNKLFNSIACLLSFTNLQLVIPGRTWILLYLGRTVYKRLWACLALLTPVSFEFLDLWFQVQQSQWTSVHAPLDVRTLMIVQKTRFIGGSNWILGSISFIFIQFRKISCSKLKSRRPPPVWKNPGSASHCDFLSTRLLFWSYLHFRDNFGSK